MPYYNRRHEDYVEHTCCAEFLYLFVILLLYAMICCMIESRYHINIDEYNLDVWDREHGLEPCCRRDNYGTIRNRVTDNIEWDRIVKDKNPFWDYWIWDNRFEN